MGVNRRRLEDLVPPLELCNLIPEGAFADSALIWHVQGSPVGYMKDLERRDELHAERFGVVLPAPTLEEIMKALYEQEDFVGTKIKDGCFHISAWREDDEEADVMISAKSATHAALSLWLKKHGRK